MQTVKTLFAVAILLLGATLIMAQTFERGEIHGTVSDPSHAVVAKANVTLTNTLTGVKRELLTADNGTFVFAETQPGTYTLTAEHEGFSPVTVNDIELHVGAIVNVDVPLPVRGQEQTIEVSAVEEAPPAGISQLINGQSVENLPLNGRDYRDLAQLTSSAQVVPNLRGGIRLGGQQSDYTGLSIDGGDAYNNFFGEFFGSLETKNFTIPSEAIQEFQVVTNGFAPEFGRSSGGLLNVVTKSGTNQVHGEIHEYYRGSKLTSDDALGNPSNIVSGNQFGGSIGFPIHKDKQFMFLATDFSRQHGPLLTNFFSCTPAAGCTQADLNATAVPELGIPSIASLEGPHKQYQNLATLLGHYDYQISSKTHFSVRGFFTRNHTNGFSSDGQIVINDSFGVTEEFNNQGANGVFALTTVSGQKANEIRLLISGETRVRHANSSDPLTTIFNVGNFGRRFFLPINNDQGKLQAQDNFTYTFGKHDMKFGGDVDAFVDRKDSFAGWNKGEYDFADLHAFGETAADQAANVVACGHIRCPLGFIQGFSLNGQDIFKAGTLFPAYQTGVGLYWQDKWRLTPRATLTYGVRWDGTWNPQPQTPIMGLDPNGQPVLPNVYIGVGKPGPGGSHLVPMPQRMPNDFDQWGPRIGVAYQAHQGAHPTLVSAAWGLYYGLTPPIFMPTGGGGKTGTLFCFGNPACLPPGGYPNLWPSTVTPAIRAAIGNPSPSYAEPSFRNPRVSNLTVGVEQQLARDMTVSIHYAYVHSMRLRVGGFAGSTQWDRNVVVDNADNGKNNCNGGLLNTNGFDPFGRACLTPSPIFGPLRQDPSIGATNELASFGYGNYHEIVASVNKRFSQHFQFFANYTWSRNKDDASSERDTDSFFGPQDPFTISLDYGRNGLDITHQFKAAGVVDLPWGVTWSNTLIAHSGLAFPAYSTDDINGDGIINQFANNDRPLVTPAGGAPFLLPRYPSQQPSYFDWDMRVNKDVRLGERYHVQLLGDVFNLTNASNLFSNSKFGGFVSDVLTGIPQPGQVFPLGPYRVLNQPTANSAGYSSVALAAQFGLKLVF